MHYSFRTLLRWPLSNFRGADLVIALVVRAVVIIGGVGFLVLAFYSLYFSDTRNWYEVKATVTHSVAHSSNPVVFTPAFTYRVDGQTYTGEGTEATERQYDTGSQITILVNPADFSDYVQLDHSRPILALIVLVLTAPFVMFGVKTIAQLIEMRQKH